MYSEVRVPLVIHHNPSDAFGNVSGQKNWWASAYLSQGKHRQHVSDPMFKTAHLINLSNECRLPLIHKYIEGDLLGTPAAVGT